jgi:hypothetical protein
MSATDYFARTGTIRIATELDDGGEAVTPIWGVVVDGVPYIRNGNGERSKWYWRLRHTGRAAFIDGPRRYRARIENVDDEDTRRQVDDAYRAKYHGQGLALNQVLSSPVREYTMRVILDED